MDPTKKRKQPDDAFNEEPSSGDGAVTKGEGDSQDLRLKNGNAIEQGLQKFHKAETPVMKATAEMVEGGFSTSATSEEQPLAGLYSEGSTTLPPDQQQPQQQQSGPSEHQEFLEEALEILNKSY